MDDNHWIEWLLGGYVAIMTWLGKREVRRVDDHDIRIRTLESNRVTHDDIDELRQSLTASMVNVCERLENQTRTMHEENRETMERIHERVDGLWERRERPRR
jgi:hypothetical protein